MSAETSLGVHFGGHTALIHCDDPDLGRSLANYFRHCLGGNGPVIAAYQITTAANGDRQLWCDGQLLHPRPTLLYLFIYLTQDIVAKLITSCRRQLVFHAAGLAWGRTGVILCGRSGSGKSTLAAWLTASGFDFLSDEIVAVGFEPLAMCGLAGPIVLKRGSTFVWQHWLGRRAEQKMLQFFDGTAWLDPLQLRPHCVRARARPEMLVFPRYAAGAADEARPLSAAEATFQLMHHLVNFENLPGQGFSQAARLARQVKAYRLTYADVTTAAAWLQETIEGQTTSWRGLSASPQARTD